MNHPLTDKMCEEIGFTCRWSGDGGEIVFSHFDMRRAADWQLEQVIKWIGENLYWEEDDDVLRYVYGNGFASIATDAIIADLKKAMRPQEDK